MGDAEDHVNVFFFLNLLYRGLGSLGDILEFQHTGGGAGQGIFSKDAKDGNFQASFVNYHIIFHAIAGKGVF